MFIESILTPTTCASTYMADVTWLRPVSNTYVRTYYDTIIEASFEEKKTPVAWLLDLYVSQIGCKSPMDLFLYTDILEHSISLNIFFFC